MKFALTFDNTDYACRGRYIVHPVIKKNVRNGYVYLDK